MPHCNICNSETCYKFFVKRGSSLYEFAAICSSCCLAMFNTKIEEETLGDYPFLLAEDEIEDDGCCAEQAD